MQINIYDETGDKGKPDPEAELRALWTAKGVPVDKQDAMIADITAKAQPDYIKFGCCPS